MDDEAARFQMVEQQLRKRGVTDPRVLRAFQMVPRHLFVPPEELREAYADHPLPIGSGQTISQPYIVALMVEQLRLQGHERVLEIGAGSGYQSAILSQLALEVYAVERLPELVPAIEQRLRRLGATNVHLAVADGSLGWPAQAPFDAIIVSAAAPRVPQALLDQLGDPGRLVVPIGSAEGQVLMAIERRGGDVQQHMLGPCLFVPLVGTQGWADPSHE